MWCLRKCSSCSCNIKFNFCSVDLCYSYISVLTIFMHTIFHYVAKGKTLCPVNDGPVIQRVVGTTFHIILQIYFSMTSPVLACGWNYICYACLKKAGINCCRCTLLVCCTVYTSALSALGTAASWAQVLEKCADIFLAPLLTAVLCCNYLLTCVLGKMVE